MASNTVEQIFVELLLNATGYNKQADDAVKKSDNLTKGLGKTEKQSIQTGKSFDGLVSGVKKTVKGIAGLSAVIAAGTGLLKLADEARKANDELNFLSKNLGMSSQEVKAWQGAAAAMGGSAQGMAGDMKNLNSSMNDFVMTGESSMLPMFNTLGVSMIDAQGKVRGTNDVMLDLADSMSKMDREQAFLMGQKLGFDEGTINTLLQGRDAMQEMVDYHKQMYTSNKQELEASRKLSENQAKLGAHWDSMKLMMGNAIIPLLVELSNIALRFFEFLQRHQKTVKTVFEGMAIFLGMLVVPLLGKALIAALAFIAPFAPFILVVGALGAAFIALYEDYKVWAEGGDSLFNWGAFSGYIDNARFSTENLGKGFLHLIGDYNSWAEVAQDGKAWLKLKGFIDENGVSLKTLREGFINLAADIVKYAIPTLQGYAEIFEKLVTGDFKGASWQAATMFQNLGDKIIAGGKAVWERATGAVDIATGQEVGTLGGTSIMNKGSGKFKGFGSDVDAYIKESSRRYGIDEKVLRGFVKMEGGWTGKMSPTGAIGTGQFTQGTWNGLAKTSEGRAIGMTEINKSNFRKSNDPRYNKRINTLATGLLAKQNAEILKKNGLPVTGENLYMLHNIGPGVISALKGGGVSAATEKAMRHNGKKSSESAAQFARRQQGIYGGHYADANAISLGASNAQAAMPKANIPASIAKPTTASKTSTVEVNVKELNVNTSSSTMSGTGADAAMAIQNKFYQFPMGPQ